MAKLSVCARSNLCLIRETTASVEHTAAAQYRFLTQVGSLRNN